LPPPAPPIPNAPPIPSMFPEQAKPAKLDPHVTVHIPTQQVELVEEKESGNPLIAELQKKLKGIATGNVPLNKAKTVVKQGKFGKVVGSGFLYPSIFVKHYFDPNFDFY
jgi:hypothetical protein